MKFIDEPKEILQRYRLEFLNSKRGCIFKQDLSTVRIGGQEIGPFQASTSRKELPNWVINILLKHNIVELAPEDAFEALRRVNHVFNIEKKQPLELHNELPSRFLFLAITEKIRRLQSDKTVLDPRVFDELEQIRRVTQFLINTRLTKLLRVAKAGITQDKLKRMTVEEKWLCKEINELLTEWKTAILDENMNNDTGA